MGAYLCICVRVCVYLGPDRRMCLCKCMPKRIQLETHCELEPLFKIEVAQPKKKKPLEPDQTAGPRPNRKTRDGMTTRPFIHCLLSPELPQIKRLP